MRERETPVDFSGGTVQEGSFGAAYAQLARAQKGHARGAPAYSVYVNRRIGRVFAACAYSWGMTPNQVTIVSAVHTFAGIAVLVFMPISVWAGVLAAVLLIAGYAWDSADGQVARLRGGGTLAGEWLDHFVDAFKIATLHLAVLVGLFVHAEGVDPGWLLVPLGYSVVATVTFFGMILNDLLKSGRGLPSTHSRGGGTALRSLILLPTDFGLLCLLFLVWGWTPIFLALYGAMLVANAAFLAVASVKWFREIKSAG